MSVDMGGHEGPAVASPPRCSTPHLIGAFLTLLVLTLLPLQLLWLRMSAGDEGVVLCGARRVLEGQVPHHDFFSIIPPASYYLLAAFFKIAGTTFASARLFHLLTAAGIYVLFLVLARRTGLSARAVWIAVPFLYMSGPVAWNVVSHHWICNLALMGSAVCLLAGEDGVRHRWWFAAGLLTALGVLTLQDEGAYWLLLSGAALIYDARRRREGGGILAYGAGVASLSVPAGAFLWAKAGLATLWAQMVQVPLSHYHGEAGNRATYGTGWRTPWEGLVLQWGRWDGALDLLASVASVGMFIVNMAVLLGAPLALMALWRRLRTPEVWRARASTFVVGSLWLAFLFTAFHRPALTNLKWAFAPALLLALELLPEKGWRSRWTWIPGVALGLPLVVMLVYNGFIGPARISAQKVVTPVGTITVPIAKEAEAVRLAASYADPIRREGGEVFCYSYNSYFYFLLGLENPTPYDNWNYTIFPRDEVDRFTARMAARPPRWLILDGNPVEGDPLIPWFERNYRGVAAVEGLTIAKYTGPSPALEPQP